MNADYDLAIANRTRTQRNILAMVVIVLFCLCSVMMVKMVNSDQQVILLPVADSKIRISSGELDRNYLELVTRDAALVILNRSPKQLDYWKEQVLKFTAPEAQAQVASALDALVARQRDTDIKQYFTIHVIEVDPVNRTSSVNGELHTIAGDKEVMSRPATYQFQWKYSGLSLQLIGFQMTHLQKN